MESEGENVRKLDPADNEESAAAEPMASVKSVHDDPEPISKENSSEADLADSVTEDNECREQPVAVLEEHDVDAVKDASAPQAVSPPEASEPAAAEASEPATAESPEPATAETPEPATAETPEPAAAAAVAQSPEDSAAASAQRRSSSGSDRTEAAAEAGSTAGNTVEDEHVSGNVAPQEVAAGPRQPADSDQSAKASENTASAAAADVEGSRRVSVGGKKHVGLPSALRNPTTIEPTSASPESVDETEADADNLPIEQGKTFPVNYMGSTQLVVDGSLSKNMRVTLAYEAVSRVKQPEGDSQPLIPVTFFVSTESVQIIHRADNITLMDHPLRSISYVADIGNLVVVMARRRLPQQDGETGPDRKSKLLCHVLEAADAHHISETIGFAFNYAYRQFLAENGIEEGSLTVSDYADILSVQKMPHDELAPFIGKGGEDEFQLVKKKGEPLGISIMESGWGSMIPTVTVSHLMKGGAATKCNRVNVGDQVLAVAGKSLVGIPMSECIDWLKSLRYLTMVKIKLVHTPPVVDVNIVRPDLKFPLGFSVLDGTVTSLLRGSIGERGGIRVGHHIIEINGHSTVNMKSEQLLDMLSTSTGHMRLKTMSLHLYRLMTGEVQPEYV
eukprot:scpid43825/ scgid0792/ Amyloid beta A4 precursor protein-binding family A member 1; Adapter protein X11alpha; Neuron-specific X11 protein; Neuronal Munc18-1-interacting protein 1